MSPKPITSHTFCNRQKELGRKPPLFQIYFGVAYNEIRTEGCVWNTNKLTFFWSLLIFFLFFDFGLLRFSLVIFNITFWTSNIYWQTSCEFQTKNISPLWVRHIQSEANISSYKQSCCFTLKLTSTRAPCFPDPNVSFTSLHSVVSGFLCILTLRSLPVLQYNCSRVWFKPQAKTFQGLFYILSFSLYCRNEKIIN